MKKLIFVFLFFLSLNCIFTYEIEDFTDSKWYDEKTVENIFKTQKPDLSSYGIVNLKFPKKNNSTNPDDWGFFAVDGYGGVAVIFSAKMENENIITFEYGWYVYSLEEILDYNDPKVCKITILNENKIELTNSPFGETLLYRKSYNSKTFENGIVNDTNVRIRMAPNTSGTILGKLQIGDKVKIISKSDISKADGVENFWYQIQVEGYPICWIFGEYITLETTNEYNLLAEQRANLDNLPILTGVEMTPKDIFSNLFFDGTWTTENKWENLKNETLVYYGSGLNEKAKAVKDDVCSIEVVLRSKYDRSEGYPTVITYHNKVYGIEYISYLGSNKYQFNIKDGSLIYVKILDFNTIEISFNQKTEIWKRISPFYNENSKLARICYDGVCLFNSPKVSEKNQYSSYLNAGQIVSIIETGKKEKIGNFEDYWYKVETYNCEIENYFETGKTVYWVYGAFLDLDLFNQIEENKNDFNDINDSLELKCLYNNEEPVYNFYKNGDTLVKIEHPNYLYYGEIHNVTIQKNDKIILDLKNIRSPLYSSKENKLFYLEYLTVDTISVLHVVDCNTGEDKEINFSKLLGYELYPSYYQILFNEDQSSIFFATYRYSYFENKETIVVEFDINTNEIKNIYCSKDYWSDSFSIFGKLNDEIFYFVNHPMKYSNKPGIRFFKAEDGKLNEIAFFDEKDLGLNYKYSEDVFPIKVPMKNCAIMTIFDYNNPKTLFFEYFDNKIVLKNSNIKGLVTSYFFKNNDWYFLTIEKTQCIVRVYDSKCNEILSTTSEYVKEGFAKAGFDSDGNIRAHFEFCK